MKIQTKKSALACGFCALILSACAAKQVDPDDRDKSGTFDGIWLAEVSGPKSSTVMITGNSTLSCEWDPFSVRFTIQDGLVTLGDMESETGISSSGNFLYEFSAGSVTQRNEVISGNPRMTLRFSGNLADDEPKGSHKRLIKTMGANGCTANIVYSRV